MRLRLALLLAVAVPSVALAHKMLLTVEVTATELRVAVKYDGADHGGGGPMVTLLRLPGKVPVDTKPTDKHGVAVFARPEVGRYLVLAEDEFHNVEKAIEVTADEVKYEDAPANRWLMIGLGVAAITALTAAAWYFSTPRKA